jgi:magnesium transporter
MVNTLFLPELREMLAEEDAAQLREFCTALHPARTAEFMEGLESSEAWKVLQFADSSLRAEIFGYFEHERQVEMLEHQEDKQVAELVTNIPADDAVDLLSELPDARVELLLALVPAPDRRDIRRLQTFPEGTAGSIMTTEAACLDERLTVRQALDKLSRQAEHLETIYYIYVVDDANRLRGVVSTRKLVSSIGKPDRPLSELMDSDIVTVNANDDQKSVTQKVAKYDLLAIPVVDAQRHMLGIITHDDVIDVVIEEAAEDVQRIAGVNPLEDSYMRTPILTLAWKRGLWLGILSFAGLSTALALKHYQPELEQYTWLVWFIPLVLGSGGNSGSQSSTLIIAAMATGDVKTEDWFRIVVRELATGVLLGGYLGALILIPALFLAPSLWAACVVPITILMVVICGTFSGSTLPIIFRRLGLQPAIMSNPFVAGINDILGILIYVNIAHLMLGNAV